MLKRKMLDYLFKWKKTKNQECLLIKGARQVGKSFIVDVFGEQQYAHYISINFYESPELKTIFADKLDADSIYKQITLLMPGKRIVPGETLLFLDEIQQCPQARTALKFLAIDGRCDVVASGSLLGLQYKTEESEDDSDENEYSTPVGYERQVEMLPLDFEEYLWAQGYTEEAIAHLREYFDACEAVPASVNTAMLAKLREYVAIGGMPAVVQAFADTQDFQVAFSELTKILETYKDDIAHYAKPTDRVKARDCYLSLPRQLAKENTRFRYSVVSKGSSARKYVSSVDWLRDAALVRYCRCVSTPLFPLRAYEETDKFRLYANDTGLLVAMYGFQMMSAVVNNTLKGPMKGGLYENLIACMLLASGKNLNYWTSKNGSREIEFLIEEDASIVPIEVKAGRGSTISLNELLENEDIKKGYKLIAGNAGVDKKKVTLPLYMAMFL